MADGTGCTDRRARIPAHSYVKEQHLEVKGEESMIKRYVILAVAALLLSGLFNPSAFACDTLELFDPGVSDFEFYLSYLGACKDEPERGIGAEVLLGIGINSWLSGQIYASGEGNEALSEGTGAFGFGIFSTPLDTDHFDFDIGLNATVSGLGPGEESPAGHSQAEFSLTPFIELNLDSDPDMNGYGFYVVVEETLGGRDESFIDNLAQEIRSFTLTPGTALTLGSYYTVREGQQVFLCYDMAFNHRNGEGERKTEVGGIALGYNGMLTEELEIISEVWFDIPQDEEDFGFNFTLGFIATLPSMAP